MKGIFVDLERCMGCKNCEVYCAVEHSAAKNLFPAVMEKPSPVRRISVESSGDTCLPLQCRHCEEAPCVDACPSGAMKNNPETGVVSHDQDRCIGCWMCAMVCPFGVISPQPDSKIVLKCDRCPDLETPACVSACPTKALLFDELANIMKKTRKNVTGRTISATKKETITGGILCEP